MSSKRKMFFIFCFCVLNIFLLIGFLVVRDATLLNTLKKEEKELLKLNITSDHYQRKIQSRGGYAVVEKTIKKYLDDYASLLQDCLSTMDDDSLTKILSYDNYAKDGPEFKESLKFVDNKKKECNDNVEKIFSMGKESNVRGAINKEINDSYYIDLYNEYMLSDGIKNKFTESEQLLASVQVKVNRAIDGSNEVLKFLVANKDTWKVEDGEIKFLTQDLYNQYMGYIAKATGAA